MTTAWPAIIRAYWNKAFSLFTPKQKLKKYNSALKASDQLTWNRFTYDNKINIEIVIDFKLL